MKYLIIIAVLAGCSKVAPVVSKVEIAADAVAIAADSTAVDVADVASPTTAD